MEVADNFVYLRKRRTAPESMPRPANAIRASSPPPLSLLPLLFEVLLVLVLEVLEVLLFASLEELDVLGEAEVSPLVLAEPLGWLMLPLLLLGLELFVSEELGVWLAEPVAPPVVELELPEVLGVCEGLELLLGV